MSKNNKTRNTKEKHVSRQRARIDRSNSSPKGVIFSRSPYACMYMREDQRERAVECTLYLPRCFGLELRDVLRLSLDLHPLAVGELAKII